MAKAAGSIFVFRLMGGEPKRPLDFCVLRDAQCLPSLGSPTQSLKTEAEYSLHKVHFVYPESHS